MIEISNKIKKRGRPTSALVGNNPFSLRLAQVLADKNVVNDAIAKAAGISSGTINQILKTGNPKIQTVWALEDALELPRGTLCAPTALIANQAEKQKEAFEAVAATAPTPVSVLPPVNAIRQVGFDMEEGYARRFVVPGKAAAFEGGGALPGLMSDDAGDQYDIEIPETTYFVKISGDSMSPLLLDGQYAMMGPEYLRNSTPPERSIVIAQVTVNDTEQAGSDGEFEGVYCKRIIDGESCWWFRSINPAYRDFSILKTDCRLWPVLGVWFAGHGVPPED